MLPAMPQLDRGRPVHSESAHRDRRDGAVVQKVVQQRGLHGRGPQQLAQRPLGALRLRAARGRGQGRGGQGQGNTRLHAARVGDPASLPTTERRALLLHTHCRWAMWRRGNKDTGLRPAPLTLSSSSVSARPRPKAASTAATLSSARTVRAQLSVLRRGRG